VKRIPASVVTALPVARESVQLAVSLDHIGRDDARAADLVAKLIHGIPDHGADSSVANTYADTPIGAACVRANSAFVAGAGNRLRRFGNNPRVR
jgi:hypothetical protein